MNPTSKPTTDIFARWINRAADRQLQGRTDVQSSAKKATAADFAQRTVIHPCSCPMKLRSSMRYAGFTWCVTAFRNLLPVVSRTNSVRLQRDGAGNRALPRGKVRLCTGRFWPEIIEVFYFNVGRHVDFLSFSLDKRFRRHVAGHLLVMRM